jgi:large subunit ribosomal protein L9
MQVILLERIEKLGQMGDVVRVKPGYARNYLLPQGKAMRATEENAAVFEQRRAQLEAANLERRTEAGGVAEKLQGLSVVLVRQAGETGILYGSVNARDIAEAVTAAGFTIDRRQVSMDRPIKELGIHDQRIQLHPEVSVTIQINVAKSEAEAEMQAGALTALVEEGTEAAEAAQTGIEELRHELEEEETGESATTAEAETEAAAAPEEEESKE